MENAVRNGTFGGDEPEDKKAEAGPILVAIDGPAGSGKSSVSHEAAGLLDFGILDTGAAYRSLAWAALRAGIDLDDEAALLTLLGSWAFDITLQGGQQVTVRVPGEDDAIEVTRAIRDPELSAQVSRVARHPRVRERLNEMFRTIVATSGLPGVVIEGRDITTVVAPDAEVRLLLTAAPEVRAQRRAGEISGSSFEQVLADLEARDTKDAAVVDFFNPAPGVQMIDTSDLSFGQSVQAVIDVVREAQGAAQRGV